MEQMPGAAAWFGIALGAVLLAEVGARQLFRRALRPVVYLPGLRLLITPREELLTHLDGEIDFNVNSDGERGHDVPRGAGLHRVLIIGGSAAECRLLSQKHSIGGRLQERLNTPEALAASGASAVHVGVLAKSMLAARDLCRMMECVFPSYRSVDTVVIVCGLADVKRWMETAAPPGPIPSLVDDAEIFDQYPGMPFTLRRPAVLRLALRGWTRWRRPLTRLTNVGGHVIRERGCRKIARFEPFDSDPGLMLAEYRVGLQKAIALARKRAAFVLLVCQGWLETEPTAAQDDLLWGGRIGNPRAPGPPRFMRHEDMRNLFRQVHAASLEVAAQSGVTAVDLTVLENTFGVYYDDIHYAEHGAKLAADTIAEAILRA